MALLSPGTREMYAARHARGTREREELAKAEREKTQLLDPDIEERKVLALLEELGPIEPPAELSAGQPPSEVVRRLEKLEAQQALGSALPPPPPRGDLDSRRNRCIEILQRLRRDKAEALQTERNQAHERRCAKYVAKLEGAIAEAESKRDVEQERHSEAMAELNAELSDCRDKLAELSRSLAADETTEQRLEKVMA